MSQQEPSHANHQFVPEILMFEGEIGQSILEVRVENKYQ